MDGCKEEVVSFYVFFVNQRKSGWERRVIYRDRRMSYTLGHSGAMHFIKLSDGRIVATNDLWCETHDGWVSSVPPGALIGENLSTHLCRPKSKSTLATLLCLLEDPGETASSTNAVWKTKSELSDIEAYKLRHHYGRHFLGLVAKKHPTTTVTRVRLLVVLPFRVKHVCPGYPVPPLAQGRSVFARYGDCRCCCSCRNP